METRNTDRVLCLMQHFVKKSVTVLYINKRLMYTNTHDTFTTDVLLKVRFLLSTIYLTRLARRSLSAAAAAAAVVMMYVTHT